MNYTDVNEVFGTIKSVCYRHYDCMETFESIVNSAKKVLISNEKDTSMYGLCFPDETIVKFFGDKGKVTEGLNSKRGTYHFVYYCDENNRVVAGERHAEGELLNHVFYYYYDNRTEVVWYHDQDRVISSIGVMYYEGNKLVRYMNGSNPEFRIPFFEEYYFDRFEDQVVKRSCLLYSPKVGPMEKISYSKMPN
ncbi:MAG: hypothetical protein J6M26_01345 [Clostridia bacterium]|nr:hypothetical protein [Clostridia bacterium]